MAAKRNSNPFPSSYEEIYYVYSHIDPDSLELLYIGHGSFERAWTIGRPGLPLRSTEHNKYLFCLMQRGYLPDEWVNILGRNLTKKEACEEERKLIKELKPKFNKIQGAKLLKVTPEILKEAFLLREEGKSYSQIAEVLNLAAMTIHRAMNGKSSALEEILERQK